MQNKKRMQKVKRIEKNIAGQGKTKNVSKITRILLYFLFLRDQNHCSNLTSKIMKMGEKILKKTAPQYNSNSLNCKKRRAPKYWPLRD